MVEMQRPDYKEYLAEPSLANAIECFWTLDSGASCALDHQVFPDGCADIVVDEQGRLHVSGITTGPRLWRLNRRRRLLGARIRPGYVRSVVGVAAKELKDRVILLESIRGLAVNDWSDRLLSCDSQNEEFRVLTRLIAALNPRSNSQSPMIMHAIELLKDSVRVSAIAQSLGVSERYLLMAFEREVGIGPKRFARVLRFQQVLNVLRGGRTPPWAELAQLLGYADQAHLVREVHEFSGFAPHRLLQTVSGAKAPRPFQLQWLRP